MTDDFDFETGLERRLLARAALASRPFDAAAIAHQVTGADVRRSPLRRLAWPVARPAFAVLILALLLVIALLGAALVGALRLGPPPIPPLPGNGWIAVSANPNGVGGGQVGDIYRVDAGAAARRIIGSDNDGVAQACPRFSPDGRRLAYGEARASDLPVTTFRGNWPVGDRAFVVVGVNGRGDVSLPLMRKTVSADPGEIACPEWSPDSTALAVWVDGQTWITNAASGETRVISTVDGPRGIGELEWSRDGRRLAQAEVSQIRVIRADDGTSEVFRVQGAIPGSLAWAAGDRQIVYLATDESGEATAVRLIDLVTRQDTKLTIDPTDPQLVLNLDNAVVSPDGTRLAYFAGMTRCTTDRSSCAGLSSQVLTFDTDGSHVVEVTAPPDFGGSGIQWSPDGTRLLMGSIDGVISVAAVAGSPAVVHSKIGDLNLEWSGSQVTWQPVVK
jgi:dipeptidyl aminopeptidase/acylaminoacyl peptidase